MGVTSSKQMRAAKAAYANYVPTQTSVIDATEVASRRPLAIGEVALQSSAYLQDPEAYSFTRLGRAVDQNLVTMLRLVFDNPVAFRFDRCIGYLLAKARNITSLEILCDHLPILPYLPFFYFPNVFEHLPPIMPSLQNLHLATTLSQHVPIAKLADIMRRAPRLRALRIAGPSLIHNNDYSGVIQSQIQVLVLAYCDLAPMSFRAIISRSMITLRSLHLEHVTGLDRNDLGFTIATGMPNLAFLTVVCGGHATSSDSLIQLYLLLDIALCQPLMNLQYLHVSGLAISDSGLLGQSNNYGVVSTPLPQLQSLVLHDCNKLSMRALTYAILERRMPSLLSLEAIYPHTNFTPLEYAALNEACAGTQISMTQQMTEAYAEWNPGPVNPERMSNHGFIPATRAPMPTPAASVYNFSPNNTTSYTIPHDVNDSYFPSATPLSQMMEQDANYFSAPGTPAGYGNVTPGVITPMDLEEAIRINRSRSQRGSGSGRKRRLRRISY